MGKILKGDVYIEIRENTTKCKALVAGSFMPQGVNIPTHIVQTPTVRVYRVRLVQTHYAIPDHPGTG